MLFFKKKKELLEKDPESKINFNDPSIRKKISEIDREIFEEDRDMLYKRVAVAQSLGKQPKPKKRKEKGKNKP